MKPKRIWAAVFLVMTAAMLAAQGQDWLWAVRAGGNGNNLSRAVAVSADHSVFTAGYYTASYSYGTSFLINSGGSDIFVAKTGANGTALWAKRAGSTGTDEAYALALDDAGNILVTGFFRETVAFGASTLTSAGYSDIFVAKLSPTGSWLWAARAGGDSNDSGWGISLDDAGNVYITGFFDDSADFGASTLVSNGAADIFVAKLNSSGTWQWARKLGSSTADYGKAICTDGSGTSVVTGYFSGTLSVGTVAVLFCAGGSDIFVAKLNSSGTWIWAKRAGGSTTDYGNAIDLDSAGNCYIAGSFIGTASFGSDTLTSAGNSDAYVAKLNGNGTWLWARGGGGTGIDTANDVSVEATDHVYAAGNFSGTASFGPTTITSAGSADAFAVKLHDNGSWHWVKRGGDTQGDYAQGIKMDDQKSVYLTGFFYGSATFGTTTLASSDSSDVFIAKLGFQYPLQPQNLSIAVSGNDLILDWDPVGYSIYGEPLTPDFYVIYRSTVPFGSYSFVGITTGTMSTQANDAVNFGRVFYKVTAVKNNPDED